MILTHYVMLHYAIFHYNSAYDANIIMSHYVELQYQYDTLQHQCGMI